MELKFEKGLLGLELYKNFVLKDIDEVDSFKLLQCKEEPDIGLILVSPFDIEKEYEFEISDVIEKQIDAETIKDLLIFTTVNVNSDPTKMTTNLRAPIIINTVSKKGIQVILNNEQYKIKHPISKG